MKSISRLAALLVTLTGTLALAADAPAQKNPWAGKPMAKRPGHLVEVNGIKLYYEIHGSGRPLVLLHGGLGAIEMFGPNLEILARSHRVIALDLQGHGRTADVDRPLALETMADDVAALLKHLRIERADVMGYSLGGGVAFQVAVRHPEIVNKLVLVSTLIRRNAFYPEILGMQGQVTAAAAEGMKQTPMYQLYASIAPRPQDFPRLLQKIGDFMKKDFDYSKELASLKAPTLIVAGDSDIFPPAHAVEMFGLLGGGKRDGGWDGVGRPRSRLAILPGLTHYNMFTTATLSATVIPFLDEGV